MSADATVTLNGKGTYIFQVGSTLEIAGTVALAGGANAGDVIWLVGSSATLDGTAVAVGNIIAQASITMDGGASLSGRAIALAGAITLIDNAITSSINSVPSVYWAYNTGGRIATSPVLSLDGKQVAFVETTGTVGILTMLKWTAAPLDTVGAPETLTPVDNSSYLGCTAPCMTQVFLNGGGNFDRRHHFLGLLRLRARRRLGGRDRGRLHKVTGVFKGTPAEIEDDTFPVQVSATAAWLSSPIYDSVSNSVFVGDSDGFLYRVNATSGIPTKSARLDFRTGLVAPPLVDSTHGLVYVFASSDGSAACAGGIDCSAVYQLSTSFTGGTAGTEVTVGNSVVQGSLTPPNPMYAGAFDSAYYNSVNAHGKSLRVREYRGCPDVICHPFHRRHSRNLLQRSDPGHTRFKRRMLADHRRSQSKSDGCPVGTAVFQRAG